MNKDKPKPKPKPNIPDIIAMLDQTQVAMEKLAVIMGSYYKSLRENGIPPELASQLTREYQQLLFNMSRPR